MSDADDFEKHVLAVEAMAARLEAAAKVFRDARLILGGAVASPVAVEAQVDEDPAAAHRRRQFQPVDDGGQRRQPQHTHPGGGLTAAERAEKERLMRVKELPDDIREAMGEQ